MNNSTIISKEEFLIHWQGHRALTRRVIEKFPEQELFTFTIGSMRSFADMVKELLSIAVPGLDGIVNGKTDAYNHDLKLDTKEALLNAWDESTPKITELYNQIPVERFHEDHNLFGEYNFPIYQNLLYFIDNEVHHRAQGYTYLRALAIEPPFFWERSF